jgi:hypothetical protein
MNDFKHKDIMTKKEFEILPEKAKKTIKFLSYRISELEARTKIDKWKRDHEED